MGIHLDKKFTFKHHINEKINKPIIGIIHKLNNIHSCQALLTFYRSFVRPELGYGDVIYDQAEKPLKKSYTRN